MHQALYCVSELQFLILTNKLSYKCLPEDQNSTSTTHPQELQSDPPKEQLKNQDPDSKPPLKFTSSPKS